MGNLVEDLVGFAEESCSKAIGLLLITALAVPLIPILLLLGLILVSVDGLLGFFSLLFSTIRKKRKDDS